MLTKYVLPAVLVALVGAVGFAGWQTTRVTGFKHDIKVLNAKLLTCNARVGNLLEDQASDAEIDSIPDDELGNVPERWLLPETGTPN